MKRQVPRWCLSFTAANCFAVDFIVALNAIITDGVATIDLSSIYGDNEVAGHGDLNANQINWVQDDALFAIHMKASILMRVSEEVV